MKAKVIATGEIIEVKFCNFRGAEFYKEVNPEGDTRYFREGALEFMPNPLQIEEIDWEQRRFELVKIVTQGYLARVNVLPINSKERKMFSELVLDATDAIIEKLKEE